MTNQRAIIAIRVGAVLASIVLLVLVAVCYAMRLDAVAAITVYPLWCWGLLGIVLAMLGLRRRRWITFAPIVAWFVFLAAYGDSSTSLLLSFMPYDRPSNAVRVVTLNCASSEMAAQEVETLEPDIVLLQESPTRESVGQLAERWFGDGSRAYWGIDASIVARGAVTQIDVPPQHRGNFVHARVVVDDVSVDVISLRLFPCPVRFDLWSPRCWAVYRENREKRRRELSAIAAYIRTLDPQAPLIVGGDFNAPPGDAVFRLLAPLTDAFRVAGRGWGGTIINELPALRIDQVWCSDDFEVLTAFARKTEHSDHRMAIADLKLVDPAN